MSKLKPKPPENALSWLACRRRRILVPKITDCCQPRPNQPRYGHAAQRLEGDYLTYRKETEHAKILAALIDGHFIAGPFAADAPAAAKKAEAENAGAKK